MNQKREKINSNPVGVAPLDDQNSKGITLIALIITIIIMLILVGVTVSVAINGGLFKTAKDATLSTQSERDEELNASTARVKIDDVWYDSLEDYAKGIASKKGNWKLSENGDTITNGEVTLNIGDYVDYTPDQSTYEKSKLNEDYTGSTDNGENLTTDTNLNWRVLGVDENGNLTLISNKPTSKSVYLQGAKGYNNGVYILNDICAKLYSNAELGIEARSLTVEDIETGYSEEGIKARDEYYKDRSPETQYGRTKTSESELKYPIIYAQEKGSGIDTDGVKSDGIGGSDSYYKNEIELTSKMEADEVGTAKQKVTYTQTWYRSGYDSPDNHFKCRDFLIMVFGTRDYWLASRYVDCYGTNSGTTDFGLRFVCGDNLEGRFLYDAKGTSYYQVKRLRPAISLNSNYVVTLCEGENSETNMHTLSKAN